MASYKIKYKHGKNTASANLQLKAGTESEAIAVLKQRNPSYKNETVVILEIKPA